MVCPERGCYHHAGISGLTASVAYVQTLFNPFLHDDIPAIIKNPDVQGKTTFIEIFRNDFWGNSILSSTSHKSYRPLTIAVFRLLHRCFGNWPVPYHATNITLHALVTSLFTIFCQRSVFPHMANSSHVSLICGILFALHPIHTEAVCCVVGCAELLAAFLFMTTSLMCSNFLSQSKESKPINKEAVESQNVDKITLGVGLRRRTKSNLDCKIKEPKILETENDKPYLPNTCNIFIILLTSALAVLCKESGLSVLGVVIVHECVVQYESLQTKKTSRLIWNIRCFTYVTWVFIVLIFRLWVMGWSQPIFAEPDNPAAHCDDRLTRFLTYSYLWPVNLGLLLYPVNLCYDWSHNTIPLVTSFTDRRIFWPLILFFFFIMLVLCIAIKLKKSKDHYDSDLRPLVLGTSMLVLPFIPASNLLFPVGFVIAERVLYLPSAGFIVLLCLAWIKVGVKLPKWKKSLNRMMALLIIFYFIRTMMRNMDWISRKSLFLSGLQTNPANPKIRYNWANYLRDSNRSVDAATEYEEVLQLYPGYVAAMNNLATILEETPTTARKAEELYVRVIQMRPWHENAYNNLANLLVKRGKYDDAVNVLVRGVRSSTNYMTHAQNLARVLVSRGKVVKAEQIYKHIVDHFCFKKSKRNCNAQVTGLLQDYGSLLANKGDRRESLKMYKLSFQSNSSNLESMAKFANALAEAGRVEQATQLITYAVGKNKEHVVDMWKIAATFWKMNKLKESKRLYEVSVKLHPENLELIGQYAAVLFETGEHAPAVKLLENLTARDSECQSEGVWRNFASILGRLGKHDEAIKLLLRCLEGLESVTNNSVSEINVRKGKIKCQLGKHKRDLSILFSRRNKIEEANTLWNQSLQDLEEGSSLNPGDKDCPITLKQMTNQNTST